MSTDHPTSSPQRASIETLKAEYEAAPREKRQEVLARMYRSLKDAQPAELDAATKAMLPLLKLDSPNAGADLALMLGALIESGADAAPLAEAIVTPLAHWTSAAGRFVENAIELDEAPDDTPEDRVIDLGKLRVVREDIDELFEKDPEAVASWFSLEQWFRPAVASLTRAPQAFAAARKNTMLRNALEALAPLPGGAYWLRVLFDSCANERLVFLLPELKQAYEVIADGVVDAGQLTVLLSKIFEKQLAEIGASGPADPAVIKTMLGEGPQQTSGGYGSHFYLYPWRAMNPETKVPEDERHWWTAPGGRGNHSVPADFQPATVEPLDGARVLFLVGPKLPSLKHRFVREIGASRMFDKLTARVSEPVALGEDGFEKWIARASAAIAAPSA